MTSTTNLRAADLDAGITRDKIERHPAYDFISRDIEFADTYGNPRGFTVATYANVVGSHYHVHADQREHIEPSMGAQHRWDGSIEITSGNISTRVTLEAAMRLRDALVAAIDAATEDD